MLNSTTRFRLPLAAWAVLIPIVFGCFGACSGTLPYRRVSPAVAFEMLRDTPNLLIVDLRSPELFEAPEGRLHRAVNIPLEQFPDRWLELAGFRRSSFLVYCQANECGVEAMKVLEECGFRYPVLIEGGLEQWSEAKFGTVTDENAARPFPNE